MDKVKTIKNYLQNQKKEWRLCQSSEAKYRMEVYDELLEVIDSLQEEPVSVDLEEEATRLFGDCKDRKGAFYLGAKWKEEQFEKNRLAACDAQTPEDAERELDFAMNIIKEEHRQPTYSDAIKYGMRLQQMKDNQKESDMALIAALDGAARGKKAMKAQMLKELPKWRYKKDNAPLIRDSIILNKYGCVAKSPSGATVSDVWVIDYDELTKLPKEEQQ